VGRTPPGADLAEALATAAVLVVCVASRVPDGALDLLHGGGWATSLLIVVTLVNGARALARAPFTLTRALAGTDRPTRAGTARAWAAAEVRVLAATVAGAVVLSLPLYAALRATDAWWLVAWGVFASITVVVQAAFPLVLPAVVGRVRPADPSLTARVGAIASCAGVDAGGGVLVAATPGRRGNAYVVGMGRRKRVVLDGPLAAWPAPLLDQVMAHEMGHVRLAHGPRRLPVTVVVQLLSFASAGWLLAQPAVLRWAGVTGAGDVRSYPLLLLLTPLFVLPARCVLAWRDRAQEREADRFALDLLRTPDHFAAMLDRVASESGADRRLPWWRRFTASHPPIAERMAACTGWSPAA
jgi:STE24 endopeptidase